MASADKERKRRYMKQLHEWDRTEQVALYVAAELVGVPKAVIDRWRSHPLRWRYNHINMLKHWIDDVMEGKP